jgi:hypothetical protein
MRPGEDEIHPAYVSLNEVKPHQFAAPDRERFIEETLAQLRLMAMEADGGLSRALAGGFPSRRQHAGSSGREDRMAFQQGAEG